MLLARPEEDAVRAESLGRHGGQSAVDAERAGHVVDRRHHATIFWRSAHDDRVAGQFRPIPFLDGRVEGVHVHVQDH